MRLEIRHFFDAGHILPDTEYLVSKGCARLHGHTYAVIVSFEMDAWNFKGGMALDFKAIKSIIDELDHRTLVNRESHPYLLDFLLDNNEDQVIEFPYIPSSENIGIYIWEKIAEKYPQNLKKLSVSVCEGYKGIERANWTHHEG